MARYRFRTDPPRRKLRFAAGGAPNTDQSSPTASEAASVSAHKGPQK